MSDFMIALLNLCLWPFQNTDCLFVFVPTVCVTVTFLFSLLFRLMMPYRR